MIVILQILDSRPDVVLTSDRADKDLGRLRAVVTEPKTRMRC